MKIGPTPSRPVSAAIQTSATHAPSSVRAFADVLAACARGLPLSFAEAGLIRNDGPDHTVTRRTPIDLAIRAAETTLDAPDTASTSSDQDNSAFLAQHRGDTAHRSRDLCAPLANYTPPSRTDSPADAAIAAVQDNGVGTPFAAAPAETRQYALAPNDIVARPIPSQRPTDPSARPRQSTADVTLTLHGTPDYGGHEEVQIIVGGTRFQFGLQPWSGAHLRRALMSAASASGVRVRGLVANGMDLMSAEISHIQDDHPSDMTTGGENGDRTC